MNSDLNKKLAVQWDLKMDMNDEEFKLFFENQFKPYTPNIEDIEDMKHGI